MKTSTLISKLNKINAEHNIVNVNEVNREVVFSINGKTYNAGIENNSDKISDLSIVMCYDEANQQARRRFFKNFNDLIKSASNN